MINEKAILMRIFEKLFSSLVISSWNLFNKQRKIGWKKEYWYNLEILFVSSFTTSSARFSVFDIQNVALFQTKVFGRNIKETTLARYFIKVTVRPSFTRSRVTMQINIKMENISQRFSCISLFKPPWSQQNVK